MPMSTAFCIETSNPETFYWTQKANRISPILGWHGLSKQRVPSRARWKFWARLVTWRRNKRWEITRESLARRISTDLAQCFTNCSLAIHLLLGEQPLKRSGWFWTPSRDSRASQIQK